MFIEDTKLNTEELMLASGECNLPELSRSYGGWAWHENEIVDEPRMRMVLLADGVDEILLVSCDLCIIARDNTLANIRRLVRSEAGLNEGALFLTATHCHSTYHYDNLSWKLLAEVISTQLHYLRKMLKPVKAMTVRECCLPDGLLINRRFEFPNPEFGACCVMFNDGTEHKDGTLEVTEQMTNFLEDLGADGKQGGLAENNYLTREVDKRLHMISFCDEQGDALATVCRVNAHPVIVSHSRVGKKVSADYPGYMCEELQKQLGGTVLIWNGAFGDVRPLNKEYSHDEAKRFGKLFAEKLLEVPPETHDIDELKMVFAGKPLPLTAKIPRNVQALKQKINELEELLTGELKPKERKRVEELHHLLKRILIPIETGDYPVEALEKGVFNYEMALLTLGTEQFCGISGEPLVSFAKRLEEITGALPVGVMGAHAFYVSLPEDGRKGGYEGAMALGDDQFYDAILEMAEIIKHHCED